MPLSPSERNRAYRTRHQERVREAAAARRATPESKAYHRDYYEKNRTTTLAQDKAKYAADPEAKKAASRAYYSRPEVKARARDRWLIKEYGITLAEYEQMSAAQGHVCAACGGPPTGTSLGLVVDHCHDTGRVRGLLCSKCNSALGLLDDDAAKVQGLLRFISQHQPADR